MLNRAFKPFTHHGEEYSAGWQPLFVEPRYHGGGANSPPDPTVAAIAGMQQTTADYPFSYLVNSLAQTGGSASLINPATGKPQNYDFTGLGTADVQNQVSSQMAGVLLAIQQGMGSQYITQRLADLKQSDPTGYAAYGQLFDKIQQEAAQTPPDMPLSKSVQQSVNQILKGSTSLTPAEMSQAENSANAQNVGSGIFLGNAPQQSTSSAVVGAVDQKQNQAETAASQYLQQGVSPSDIQYRTIQQNMKNLGAFINGQNPTAEFSSLSGAQQGAAPNPNTGYTPPTMNPGQAAAQGISQANQGFAYQNELAQGTANPYLAGLSFGIQGLNTAASSGMFSGGVGGSYTSPAAYSGFSGAFGMSSPYGVDASGAAASAADYAAGAVPG